MLELLNGLGKKGTPGMPRPGSWRRIAPTLTPASSNYPWIAYKDGWLYYGGGEVGSNNNVNLVTRKTNVNTLETVALANRPRGGNNDAYGFYNNKLTALSYRTRDAGGAYGYYNRNTFDLDTESWGTETTVPGNTVANSQRSFVTVGDTLYTFGGSDANTWQATMRRMGLVSGTPINLGKNIGGRSSLNRGAALVHKDGKIYVMGGQGQTNWISTISEYDIATDTSSVFYNVNTNKLFEYRSYSAAMIRGDVVYNFFGIAHDNLTVYTNSILVMNLKTKAFEILKDVTGTLPPARLAPAHLMVDDKAYFFGGTNSGNFGLNDIWEYTFKD